MRFANTAHRDAYERVERYVTDLFGDDAETSPEEPTFTLSEVFGHRDDRRATKARELERGRDVLLGRDRLPVSEERLRFLLEENAQLLFGAFGLRDGTNVIFKHSVIGETLDPGELGGIRAGRAHLGG